MSIDNTAIPELTTLVNKAACLGIDIEISHKLAGHGAILADTGYVADPLSFLSEHYEALCPEVPEFTLQGILSLDDLKRKLALAAEKTKIRFVYNGLDLVGELEAVYSFYSSLWQSYQDNRASKSVVGEVPEPHIEVVVFGDRPTKTVISIKGIIRSTKSEYPYQLELYNVKDLAAASGVLASLGKTGDLEWVIKMEDDLSKEVLEQLTGIMTGKQPK